MRQILIKLDNMDNESAGALTSEELIAIRRQLADGQTMLRETLDRLRQSQEETEMIVRRKDELDVRVGQLEADYEELLGKHLDFEKIMYNGWLIFLRTNRENHS